MSSGGGHHGQVSGDRFPQKCMSKVVPDDDAGAHDCMSVRSQQKSQKIVSETTRFLACSRCHIQGGVLCWYPKCCAAVLPLRLLFQKPSSCPGGFLIVDLRHRPFFPFRCLQQISEGCLHRIVS